jgi:hypothetical protein
MKANLHVGWPREAGASGARGRVRTRVRWAAAVLALANAVVYALIGAGVLSVLNGAPGPRPGLIVFGVLAGGAFLLGAVLLMRFDRRVLWMVGAAFQAFAIAAYFNVAPQRVPPYEVWGLSLKVAQAVLLVALLFLGIARTTSPAAPERR